MSNCRGVCGVGGGDRRGGCRIKCPKGEKYSIIFIKRIGGLFFSKICEYDPAPYNQAQKNKYRHIYRQG